MLFSDKFNVSHKLIKDYGAVDISLVCDMPLFVDPMLIFNSEKREYKELHNEIIKYFHFLYRKSQEHLSQKEISAWFNFSEVPNNWLGYSLSNNKGLALGSKYAKFLHDNIAFFINTNGIASSEHIEKIMLLYEGSGKDKISDLTVNLIKGFLCEYTENFAKKYIAPNLCDMLPVERAYFNFETESFVSKEYFLPYIYNEHSRKEYILLTPCDILRESEPSINRDDFYRSYDRIRESIDNTTLRAYLNGYIRKAVSEYEEQQKNKHRPISESSIRRVEKDAFKAAVKDYPELYDYYIKLVENDTERIKTISKKETEAQIRKFIYAAKELNSLFKNYYYQTDKYTSAIEESRARLCYLKHIIENCDGYKNLYLNGEKIATEADLQRLFRLVWYESEFQVDAEANNGRGQADFIVSKGSKNKVVIEFKLASNSKLSHVFEQAEIYETANQTRNLLVAIFYFTEDEYEKSMSVIKESGFENSINDSIFLIDCRNDNKPSASVA